jgi:hypothetical protein
MLGDAAHLEMYLGECIAKFHSVYPGTVSPRTILVAIEAIRYKITEATLREAEKQGKR